MDRGTYILQTTDWRTGGLVDWQTGGLADWQTDDEWLKKNPPILLDSIHYRGLCVLPLK